MSGPNAYGATASGLISCVAITKILGLGVSGIVVERGDSGASYRDRNQNLGVPAFDVAEIDPIGAGDCFGATLVTRRLQGHGIADSLR